ncbi:hypothetical protein YC2023_037079 [Brassica napus]
MRKLNASGSFFERNSRIFGGQASTSDTLFASWIEWSVTGYYLALVVLRLVDHCCSSTSASSLRTASCSCLCFVLKLLSNIIVNSKKWCAILTFVPVEMEKAAKIMAKEHVQASDQINGKPFGEPLVIAIILKIYTGMTKDKKRGIRIILSNLENTMTRQDTYDATASNP